MAVLTLGAIGTASCGSSDQNNRARETGGAGGGGGVPAASAAGPNSGGSGEPVGIAGQGGSPSPGAGGEGGGAGSLGTSAGAGGDDAMAIGGAGGAGGAGGTLGGAGAGAGGEGGSAPPAFIVYNTGVDDQGVVLEGGAVDPHYTLLQSPDTTYTGPDAIVTTQIAAGYWLAQSDTSKWIAPTPNQSYPGADPCNATGVYVWRTTFDLTGYDLDAFSISGGWASDNYGTAVRLNGVVTGLTNAGYSGLSPFTLDSGFVSGVNTLDFEVTDVGCPNGLRVELTADTGAGGAGGASTL
jgi:hypothetical protein